MWTCVSCGETENEESFKFCFACGAPGPAAEVETREREGLPGPPPTRELSPVEPEEEPRPEEPRPEPEEQENGFRLPKALTSLGQKLRQATSSGDEKVVSVKVSAEAQEALDLLLQAGRFDDPADAAGFLLEEGVKAQSELLWVIREKLSEIERLRCQLGRIGRRQQ